jgi:hypothetical protein
MVKIVDYKTYQKENGEEFNVLEVQGGIEIIKSKTSGRNYLTAKKATISCTFDKATCESLKGTQMDGVVKKVVVEPYAYTVKETGEELTLTHRYEFMSEEEQVVKDNLIEEELVV